MSDQPLFDVSEGLLTSPEVERAFGVSKRTVAAWRKAKRIPALPTPGGHWRYSKAWVRRNGGRVPE